MTVDTKESIRGSVVEVFLVFLRLGCVSFGGPVAHLGYFQKELWQNGNGATKTAGPGTSARSGCMKSTASQKRTGSQ